MTKSPWTDPDPQPGDFDAELAAIDPRDAQQVDPGAGGKVTILVKVEGEDAERLQRISNARGQPPAEVVASLLREA